MSETILTDTSSAPAARLGAELRNARLSLGWELGDLARSLRIRQAYLEAIEAGRMAELPGSTYAFGFVRTYASALGLPGEQVASRLRAETGDTTPRPALSFPAPVPQRGVPAGALMLLGLVVLAGAYSGWYYVSEHQHTAPQTVPPIPDRLQPAQPKPAPSPQVASILPSAGPPAPLPPGTTAANQAASASATAAPSTMAPATPNTPPAAALTPPAANQGAGQPAPSASSSAPTAPTAAATAAAPGAATPGAPPVPPGTRVVIKATADAWVTVKPKGGGAAVLNKLMHAGDIWNLPADKTNLVLTTGNAGGTELDVDGKPAPSIGGNGMVRRDLPLDPEMLKTGSYPPLKPRKPTPPPTTDE